MRIAVHKSWTKGEPLMVVSKLFDRLVGRTPNWKWTICLMVTLYAIQSTIDVFRGKSVLDVFTEAVGIVVAFFILGGLFLAFNGGPSWIRTEVSVQQCRLDGQTNQGLLTSSMVSPLS